MNRYLKWLGQLMTIGALIFVLYRLMHMPIDFSILWQSASIFPAIMITLVMTVIVLLNYLPWKRLVELFSAQSMPHDECMHVYTRSNLLKYVPGNVFQYVGRNALALSHGLSHITVATATFLDVLMTVVAASIISLIFLGDMIMFWLVHHPLGVMLALGGGLIVIFVMLSLLYFFKKQISQWLSPYQHVFQRSSFRVLGFGIVYYIGVLIVSSLCYLGVLVFMLDVSLTYAQAVTLGSAYTLAWLIGFLVPGAPAGIGIKEAVMMAVTQEMFHLELITLSMVVLRVLSILADLVAYMCVFTYQKYHLRKEYRI